MEGFINISQYLQRTREERRAHLILSESCIEIGGDSRQFRGMLAHHVKTIIRDKFRVLLCHACNNPKCSNVNHLYWGTAKDNTLDEQSAGTYKSFYQKTIEKYGTEEYQKMHKEFSSKGGKHLRK